MPAGSSWILTFEREFLMLFVLVNRTFMMPKESEREVRARRGWAVMMSSTLILIGRWRKFPADGEVGVVGTAYLKDRPNGS